MGWFDTPMTPPIAQNAGSGFGSGFGANTGGATGGTAGGSWPYAFGGFPQMTYGTMPSFGYAPQQKMPATSGMPNGLTNGFLNGGTGVPSGVSPSYGNAVSGLSPAPQIAPAAQTPGQSAGFGASPAVSPAIPVNMQNNAGGLIAPQDVPATQQETAGLISGVKRAMPPQGQGMSSAGWFWQ